MSNSALAGLLECVAATERTLPDLERAVVVSGIGAGPFDEVRLALVRLQVMAQRSAHGRNVVAQQKAAKADRPKVQVPVSIYVKVRYYGGAYLARTSPPAATGKASSTSDAKSAAIAAARKAVPNGQLTGAFEETGGLWRVEFSVTS